jgi:uncharacterized protein
MPTAEVPMTDEGGGSRPAAGAFRSRHAALLLLALLATARPASAESTPGAAEPGTVLRVSERAERALARDRLRVELRAEATDADARRLQDAINRRMAAALARAKEATGITVATTGYTVFEEQPGKPPARWRGGEGLSLTGGDFGAVLALAGSLQEQGLVISGLAAELSREAARSVEDELAEAALQRLGQRAERIAAALGMAVAGYRSVRLGNVAVPPLPFRVAAKTMTPPVAEPGDATLALEVEAEVLLRR